MQLYRKPVFSNVLSEEQASQDHLSVSPHVTSYIISVASKAKNKSYDIATW